MTLKDMERAAHVVGQSPPALADALELAQIEQADWKPRYARILASGDPTAADGLFYNDLREPFLSGDQAAVTLATTNKALYPVSAFPVLGGQYWARPGKKLHIRAFGKITTAVTPGNGQFAIYYGTGADANGTIIASTTAVALTASQTNLSWEIDFYVHCRTTGASGTLFCTGKALFNNAVIANTLQPLMLPASAAVVSGAVDLTAANIISLQFNRSGSTAETMTVQDLEITALN